MPELSMIGSRVRMLLEALEPFAIATRGGNESLPRAMAGLPRSGHACRIDYYDLRLPKQSVLDHILALAHQADVILGTLNRRVDQELLAEMIAFHDLAEALVGDAPCFTRRELARDLYISPAEFKRQEQQANEVIAKTLPPQLGERFQLVLSMIETRGGEECVFFRMLDKSEPIISVWRYIYWFRDHLDIDAFIRAMGDFFDNPNVAGECYLPAVQSLIGFLQDRENARAYFREGAPALSFRDASPLEGKPLRRLIQDNPMHFANQAE